MAPIYEPSYEEIKDLALKLYQAKNPNALPPNDEKLKVEGYWTRARLILPCRIEMPKYIGKAFYSREAHLERLKDLLSWARTDEQVQKCIKNKALKKAARLIVEQGMEKFGVDKRYAWEYAKVIIARLKSKVEIYTKWGFI
jgi:hypothetical protein